MADKFSFEEGASDNKEITLDSIDALETCLRGLGVFTEIQKRVHDVVVRTQAHVGGNEFLARMDTDLFWLRDVAYKREKRGAFTLYYIKLDGRKVEKP